MLPEDDVGSGADDDGPSRGSPPAAFLSFFLLLENSPIAYASRRVTIVAAVFRLTARVGFRLSPRVVVCRRILGGRNAVVKPEFVPRATAVIGRAKKKKRISAERLTRMESRAHTCRALSSADEWRTANYDEARAHDKVRGSG